jgi:hypothetical protein
MVLKFFEFIILFLYLNIVTNLAIIKIYYILPTFPKIYYTKYLKFEI